MIRKYFVGLSLIISALINLVKSQDEYNYNNHGLDWPGKCTENTSTRQSPIDIEDIKGYHFNSIFLTKLTFLELAITPSC